LIAAAIMATTVGASAQNTFAQSAAAQSTQPAFIPPVDTRQLEGRWYEVGRVPNKFESDCEFATSDWQALSGGKFSVVQTCRRGLDGPGRVIRATAQPVDPGSAAKWRMTYFGGLVHREYWVLDHAPDNSWLILGMPGGHYVWVLARRPEAPPNLREHCMRKIAQAGYDASRLVFPNMAAEGG
jgi:apolipoprotein D and lipocalin family protein